MMMRRRLLAFLAAADSILLIGCASTTASPAEDGSCNADDGGCSSSTSVVIADVARGAVSEEQLQELESFLGDAKPIEREDDVQAHRNITWLSTPASEQVLSLFWGLAKASDARMPSWGLVAHIAKKGRLRAAMRSLQVIEYADFAGADSYGPTPWFQAGSSLFVVSVSLTSAGEDYGGGNIEVQVPQRLQQSSGGGGGQRVHSLGPMKRGDVVVCRGWDLRREYPVTSGTRKIVMLEFWMGPKPNDRVRQMPDTDDTVKLAIEADPDNSELHIRLGELAIDRKDYGSAVASFEQAVSLDSHSFLAKERLAFALGSQEKYAAAAEVYSAAVELAKQQDGSFFGTTETDIADGIRNHGTMLVHQGDQDGALKKYKEAVSLNPVDASSHMNIGIIYAQKEEYKKATKALKKAIKIEPTNELAQFNLGISLWAVGELKKAAKSLKAAVDLNPSEAERHNSLGEVLRLRDDFKAAQWHLSAALRLNPDHKEAAASLKQLRQDER